MACAAQRLTTPAPSPRVHVENVDPLWERVIARCLERWPVARFTSAGDVARALAGAAPRRRWRLPAVLAAASLVALGVGGYVVIGARHRQPAAERPPAVTARKAIAVLGFKNLARRDDVAWLSTAFAEMLTTELGAGGELRTIPGETLARMKTDLALDDAESYAPDTLDRIRRNVGADYVVLGAYVPIGGKVRLDVRLQDAATGETVLQVADSGTDAELATLVTRTGAQLRDRLRIGPLSPSEQAIVNAALPSSPEAARDYAEGLARQRVFATPQARELLERAIALEPGFPQAHAALAEALAYQGNDARAREEAKKALDLAAKLPDDERLRVEGLYYTITADPARAVKAYQQLFARYPDSVEWGTRLASAQFSAGDDAAGGKTLDQVRRIPGIDEEPRVYFVLQQAALMRQNYGALKETSARLAATGRARGALSLVSAAKHAEAVALWFEGDIDAALASADEAREIAFTVGDRDAVAYTLSTRGWIATDKGSFAAARKQAEQALQIAGEIGSRRRIWGAEHVLAREALHTGDLAEARRHFEASKAAADEVGSKYGAALAQLGLAVTMGIAGQLKEAKPLYDKIIGGFRLFAPKHNIAYSLHYYGDLQESLGDLAAAHKAYDEALATREQIGEKLQGERVRVSIAKLDLLEGRPGDAEAQLRQVVPAFAHGGLDNDLAIAQAVLARALRAQGRDADAGAALVEAVARAEGSESIFVRMEIALARAEVLPGLGATRLPEAERLVDAAVAEATTKGYLGYAYQLRLARAQLLVASRRAAVGRAAAGELATEAGAHAYALIATRAAALAK
jgi:TolB-like protein